ncbi:MAG: MAPEG family protein [Myxococcota bacterium]
MTIYIIAALALWLAQTFYAASYKTVFAPDAMSAVQDHMKGKDDAVALSLHGARAQRAHQNLLESMLVFLPLALLLEMRGDVPALGTQGALLFLVGRALYVPAYHFAFYGLRTTVWTVSLVGLCMMVYALLA